MTWSGRCQPAVVAVLIIAASLMLGAPGVAAAAGEAAPAVELGGQPGQAQTTANTSQPNASTNATVTLSNQTSNSSTVTVERAMLPEGGFIVLHSGAFEAAGVLEGSAIAVSEPLSAGNHRNVTLDIERSPPGGSLNQSALNGTDSYTAILYRDTNSNGRFDYLTSAGSADAPYIVGSGPNERLASSTAQIIVSGTRGDPNATTPSGQASITFENQRTNGSSLTVQSVTLPQGGWVVVHNASYTPPQSDPLGSTIGISPYLDAGEHQNVTVELINGTVTRNQTLIARPSMDTNDNQRYDYVRSQGFQDVGYTVGGEVLTDRAQVSVPGSVTATATPTATATETATPTATSTSAPTTTSASTATSESEDGGFLDGVNILWAVPLALGVLGVAGYAYARSQSRRR